MRAQLRRLLHRRLALALGMVGITLGALGIGCLLGVLLGVPMPVGVPLPLPLPLPLSPPQPTEPPPQAAASAPEPTLAAVEPAIVESPEPASPFAGITALPPEPPKRTGMVTHAVKPGEVLWQIADDYNLRPETILWANDLPDPDLLLVGQQLQIPPEDGVLYTVRPGDQLADIVARYGVDLGAVIKDNALADPDQIQAGTDIFLPGGRPIAPAPPDATVQPGTSEDDQAAAGNGPAAALPSNIDALLSAGWLSAQHVTNLYKTADPSSPTLDQLPGAARLERVDGPRNGRIEVRDPGDGRTRQAMTGWVNASDLDVGRAPAPRELPQAYPADTAMDIAQVFAPYRSQLDGSPYAAANCGPTAIGMAMDAFGVSVPPPQVRQEALNAQHMYGNGVGTLITALAQVVQQHGLSALDLHDTSGGLTHWSLEQIRAHLQAGHPVVVQVRYRFLPGRGGALYYGDHYILVTGLVADGFLYNDPIDIDGLGWDRVISGPALQNAMNASASQYAYTAFAVSR